MTDLAAGTYPLDPRDEDDIERVEIFDCLGRGWAYRRVMLLSYDNRRSGFPTAAAALHAARVAAGLGDVGEQACVWNFDGLGLPDLECEECRWPRARHGERSAAE